MKKYFPILLSKSGEISALSRLAANVKNEISPIIEVLESLPDPQLCAMWSFEGNQLLLDFSIYEDEFDYRKGKDFFDKIFACGVNAVPVIQANSDIDYINLVIYLIATYNCLVAIRISNGSGGFNNLNVTIQDCLNSVGINRNQSILIIDFGYVEAANYNLVASLSSGLILAIPNRGDYNAIVLASGSFPENLNDLAPRPQPYRLKRYEWDIWQQLIANPDLQNIAYGDYGNKNPSYIPVSFSGSSSIKYTVTDEFVIYRGLRAQDHQYGNGQYITLSGYLIATPDYSGVGFSWGDDEITRISNEVLNSTSRKPGSATTWVIITQNHHVTFLHSIL